MLASWGEQHVMIRRLLVSVIDDDESLRESLPDLVREFGYSAQVFPSAEVPCIRLRRPDQMSYPRCLNAPQACPDRISNGNCPAAGGGFRSSSSPLAPVRLFAPDYSNKVQWSAFQAIQRHSYA